MMVLWEFGGMTEGELGRKVYLDSGTLAPLLKRMLCKFRFWMVSQVHQFNLSSSPEKRKKSRKTAKYDSANRT